MKKFKVLFGAAIMFAALLPSASFATEQMTGLWENTVTIKMEGVPFEMPAITNTSKQCYTKENSAPQTFKKEDNCEMKDVKHSGTKTTWKVYCKSKDGVVTEGAGEMIVTGNKYSGTYTSTMIDKGHKMSQSMKMAGKKLGECPK